MATRRVICSIVMEGSSGLLKYGRSEHPVHAGGVRRSAGRPLRGRLAPSPTGHLHLGNARSFLLAWLDMRSRGGEIILRIEDIDGPRRIAGADRAIVHDLEWIGLDWDNELTDLYYQSRRGEYYRQAIEQLRDKGALYECFCSRRELRGIASAPHGRDPVYPGTCWGRGAAELERLRDRKTPSLRFHVRDDTIITFEDRLHGSVTEQVATESGDFIVIRADGIVSYQLAVVVDDIAMGVTDVLRGDDLLASTARQILLFRTFNATAPVYTHVPLMHGPDGERLAKRNGAPSLAELRNAGRQAQEIVGFLAWSCGLIDRNEPLMPSDLLKDFSLGS